MISKFRFIRSIDPREFAARFSEQDKFRPKPVNRIKFEKKYLELEPFLDQIPDRESDAIIMYFFLKKHQKEIARVLRVTQGAISSRIKCGLRRLKFLVKYKDLTAEDLRRDLKGIFDNQSIGILAKMLETSCYSLVAEQLELTQVVVRYRFLRILEQLEEESKKNEKLKKYYEVFDFLKNNLNILREIKMTRWPKEECFVG